MPFPGISRCSRHPLAIPAGLLLLAASAAAGEPAGEPPAEKEPERVVVTATPIPAGREELNRAAEVLTREELEASGAVSVAEALERLTSVTVRERGGPAVQGDLSVRGSSFEQVLVALDGLPLVDRQTGHHNLDLPIPLRALERVEVLPGPGTAEFGPAAFGGAVNLVTRRPEKDGLWISGAAGSHGLGRGAAQVDFVRGAAADSLSASWEESGGFRDGTDYRVLSFWNTLDVGSPEVGVRLAAGYADKDFGARDFYAPYPSRELTETALVDLSGRTELPGGWSLAAAARYRRHEDEFILIEDDPSFYRNLHETESFTERLTLRSPDDAPARLALGIERGDHGLDSSSLGRRSTYVNSAFAACRLGRERGWSLDLGLRVDDDRRWGAEVSPSLGAGVQLADWLRARAAAGRAIRPPSFTELYYVDPGNIGDPDLEPEEAWGAEAGFDAELPWGIRLSATGFLRRTDELIDWVRAAPADPWEARNVGEARFSGIEFSASGRAGVITWRAGYGYTDLDDDAEGLQSKYARNVARHDVRLGLGLVETRGLSASVTARWRDVPELETYWLADATVGWRWRNLLVFARGTNLLDEDYQEIPGVPTPGAAFELGLELTW